MTVCPYIPLRVRAYVNTVLFFSTVCSMSRGPLIGQIRDKLFDHAARVAIDNMQFEQYEGMALHTTREQRASMISIDAS